ncbi:MAG: DUF1501 domain-containing protein [Planctomycetota bacterium]|nr:MAG: DUF1501 domain-containing protein [Planctomycetota bacterium]
MLQRCSNGFGALALTAMLLEDERSRAAGPTGGVLPAPHHEPRARHVIFCYMSGGVSHVDTFDPKPRLQRDHGKPMPVKIERTQFNNNGNIMGSPFRFRRHGESGIPVSSIFPHTARHVDKLAVVRSMTTTVNEHAQGNFMMHTGFPFMGHPSAGAWAVYGLGTENARLPGYVVLQSGDAVPPHGGVPLYSSGFLPAQFQGSIIRADAAEPVQHIRPLEPLDAQRRRLDFVRGFDDAFLTRFRDDQVAAAIQNYETAFRMQSAVPELCDISGETKATLALYGVDSADRQKAAYARQCLLARRLVDRGVRFIELSCLTERIGAGNGPNPWDQHGKLKEGHAAMAHQVDQPIAGLLTDLQQRGLLERTLVIWAGEFGRTPFSQGSDGRDHNPFGFTVWMAGGGIKGGTIHGATDEFGYRAVESPCTIYDMWATVLHLLGLDHERLTYRYGGRDFRLTDVHGHVLKPILA